MMDMADLRFTNVLAASRIYCKDHMGETSAKYMPPNLDMSDELYRTHIMQTFNITNEKMEEISLKAYGHILKALSPGIAQLLMNAEPNNVVAFIRALDRKNLKKNTSNVVQNLEQYVNLPFGEKDNINNLIDKLNHYVQQLVASSYPNFVDPRLRGVLLLTHLPPSWKAWRDALYGSIQVEQLTWDVTVEKIRVEVQRRALEHAFSSQHNNSSSSSGDSSYMAHERGKQQFGKGKDNSKTETKETTTRTETRTDSKTEKTDSKKSSKKKGITCHFCHYRRHIEADC